MQVYNMYQIRAHWGCNAMAKSIKVELKDLKRKNFD